jgi:hypothetical protein
MKRFIQFHTILLGCFLTFSAHAQLPTNRIRPGTMYYAGDTVRSPRLGLQAKIPEGWEGVLPRESEVFLLVSNTVNGEIYVAANENIDRETQIKKWKAGMEISEGLRIMPGGEITTRGDILCVVGKVTGTSPNTSGKIYLEAKCSPYGFCITYMLTCDPASYEKVKGALQSMVDNTTFSKPSNESPYLHFNWRKFLSGKVLLNIDYEETSKREDEVNLCADGTFQSDITRRGVFKDQSKDYKGKKKGTWDVKSNGEKAALTFTFEKLQPVTINLEIVSEELHANGRRYFLGNSEKCK